MYSIDEVVEMHVQSNCTYIDLNLDEYQMKELRKGEIVYCESDDRSCVVKLSFWNGGCCEQDEDYEEESKEGGD